MEISMKEFAEIIKGDAESNPYIIGEKYLIRTVTMIYTGKLKAVYKNELLIEEAAWIPETDRYSDTVKKSIFKEVEPYVGDVIIGRGGILDVTAIDNLPRTQK